MYTHEYEILAVHITINGAGRCVVTVAIESSPHRFKAYQRIGVDKGCLTAGEGLYQEVAAGGGKLFPKDAKKKFPELLEHYKYEG